ncbi:MAG: phosphoribosyl-ATP pyrophosphohydrolase [Candidatus Nanohalobium sp.]
MSDLPKLVRDRIPKIIRENNQEPEIRSIPNEEAGKWLRRKVVEEAREFEEDGEVEELADLFAVMEEYMERKDIAISELREIEDEKSEEREAVLM